MWLKFFNSQKKTISNNWNSLRINFKLIDPSLLKIQIKNFISILNKYEQNMTKYETQAVFRKDKALVKLLFLDSLFSWLWLFNYGGGLTLGRKKAVNATLSCNRKHFLVGMSFCQFTCEICFLIGIWKGVNFTIIAKYTLRQYTLRLWGLGTHLKLQSQYSHTY